jgi:hypothetical protein
MKFFTPDLLERYGSADDRVARTAHEELERHTDEYLQKLQEFETRLPRRLRDLLNQYYLHDARVISHPPLMITDLEWLEQALRLGLPLGWRILGEGERRMASYWIPLQLDPPPRELLVLQYRSVRIENVQIHESLFEYCPYLEWQHDELELIEVGEGMEFRHSILFTRGLELQLRFQDFDFATLKPMEVAEELAGVEPR